MDTAEVIEKTLELAQSQLSNYNNVARESARCGAIIEDHIDDMTWLLRRVSILGQDELPGTLWRSGCRIDKDKVIARHAIIDNFNIATDKIVYDIISEIDKSTLLGAAYDCISEAGTIKFQNRIKQIIMNHLKESL